MLKPSEISDTQPSSTRGSSKSIKINSVVTKGNIRIAPKPGFQVVSSNAAPMEADVSEVNDRPDADLVAKPETASNQASWLAREGYEAEPAHNDEVTNNEPPLKLIKLVAAAAVLGVAAIVLTVLQFSGSPSETSGDQAAAGQDGNRIIAAATSGVPSTAERLGGTSAASEQEQTSALVAQIAAGTLAALRNGRADSIGNSVEGSSATSGLTPVSNQSAGQGNGLYAMVLAALEQGQSESYIDQMVNEAYRTEQVTVPALLLTASGKVDTKALLTLFGKD